MTLAPYCLAQRFKHSLVLILCLALPLASASSENADGNFDSATGYRIKHYRAPVTEDPPGVRRVTFDDVERLLRSKETVLIDAMAAEGGGPDPATGQWRITKPRRNIPGSHWLPDVGKGVLEACLSEYFKSSLMRLTGGDTSRTLIIYCQADCWMGWNAAKRAASFGYMAVYWYPEGSDGWLDWDGTLADAGPVPLEPGQAALCSTSQPEERR